MDWPQETYSVRWPLGLTIRLLDVVGISALRVCRCEAGVWDNTWGWFCKWYGPSPCRLKDITLHLRKLRLLVEINTQNWANPLPLQTVQQPPPPTHTKCLHTEGSPAVTYCSISIRLCSELLFGVQIVRYKITSLFFWNAGQNIKTRTCTEIQKRIKESHTEWHHNEFIDLTL